MAGNPSRDKGQHAYAKADAALGVPPPGPPRSIWIRLPFGRWVAMGRTPSLWVYSRLLLLLGVVSILAGILLSVIGAVVVAAVFHQNGTGIAVTMVISAFTFGTPAAVFLSGSGGIAYLAARNDRESGKRTSAVEQSESSPHQPVDGIVPKMDLGDYDDHKNDDP